MSFLSIIKSNPEIKKKPHWLLIPRGQVRPTSLVKFFVSQHFLEKEKDCDAVKKSNGLFPIYKF